MHTSFDGRMRVKDNSLMKYVCLSIEIILSSSFSAFLFFNSLVQNGSSPPKLEYRLENNGEESLKFQPNLSHISASPASSDGNGTGSAPSK